MSGELPTRDPSTEPNTVGELLLIIKRYPDDMPLTIHTFHSGTFSFFDNYVEEIDGIETLVIVMD